MVRVGLYLRVQARPGKEAELESFLKSAEPLARDEATTTAWFAVRFAPDTFAIFDVFADVMARHRAWDREVDSVPA